METIRMETYPLEESFSAPFRHVSPLNENIEQCYLDKVKVYDQSRRRYESSVDQYLIRDTPEGTPEDNPKNTRKGTRKGCYTCTPRRKVEQSIILESNGLRIFHDLNNRNLLILTPIHHYETLDDFREGELETFFRGVHAFCVSWGIEDYAVTFNQGSWKSHPHFHAKLKTEASTVQRMRGTHFKRIRELRRRGQLHKLKPGRDTNVDASSQPPCGHRDQDALLHPPRGA